MAGASSGQYSEIGGARNQVTSGLDLKGRTLVSGGTVTAAGGDLHTALNNLEKLAEPSAGGNAVDRTGLGRYNNNNNNNNKLCRP